MKRTSRILLSALVCLTVHSLAQETNYENWTSLGFRTRMKKLELSASTELRNSLLFGHMNRASLDLEASYPLFKGIRAGAGYSLIDFYDSKYEDMQFRQRFSVFASGKVKSGQLTFSLKEKAQITFKDDSDRIKSDGTIDSYETDPSWAWRNKMKVAWNIRHSHFTPSLSAESFCRVGKPSGNGFYKMRYTLATEYRLNKHHSFEVYGLLDQDVSESSSVKTWVLGLGYDYTLHK